MYSIDEIKEALIEACIKSESAYFKPYLSSDKVTTEGSDKESFFKYFRYYIINVSPKTSEGELHLKIKKEYENVYHYEFYDEVHLHPRLTIIVEENDDSIHLDILPF